MSDRARDRAPAPPPGQTTRSRRLEASKTAFVPAKAPLRISIGAGSIVSVLILMVILAAWGLGMSYMLLSGDRLSQALIVQNSEMQDAYEQRLQAFRAEIARLTLEMEQSRFDQNTVEGRVVELGRRQRQIEARLLALYRLADLIAPGVVSGQSIPGGTTGAPGAVPMPPQRTAPPAVPPGNRGAFEWEPPPVMVAQLGAPPATDPNASQSQIEMETFITRMDAALNRAAKTQEDLLTLMFRVTEARVSRFKAALAEIGMPEDATIVKGRAEPALPQIILPISEQNTPFAQRIAQIRQNFGLMHRIRYVVDALPLLKPTPDEIRYSSGFGFRIHPIRQVQRMHAGIDMAAPIGTPVRSAGSGVVLSAGWGGGYGNLIQIDHGNGLVTRYAHLSQIGVTAGQPVSTGSPIGLMGTTGASTGSHLHFETRINGNPVNPACFMLAGDRMRGRNTVPLTCDQKPAWGRSKASSDDDDEDDDS